MLPSIIKSIKLSCKILSKSEIRIPKPIANLQKFIKNEDKNAPLIAREMDKHENIKERMLGLVNSEYLSHHTQYKSVLDIISQKGIYATYCIFCAAVLEETFKADPALRAMLIHGKKVAIASAKLAQYTPNTSAFDAYISGLVHDIGAMFFVKINQTYMKVHENNKNNPLNGHKQELEFLGTSHAFASAVLANKMGLKSVTNRALLFHHDENIHWCLHHDPKAASSAALLMLANYIVNTMENENALTLDQLKYRNLAKSLLPGFPDQAFKNARLLLIQSESIIEL
jgi:HD-like signal output (HDOD) protein